MRAATNDAMHSTVHGKTQTMPCTVHGTRLAWFLVFIYMKLECKDPTPMRTYLVHEISKIAVLLLHMSQNMSHEPFRASSFACSPPCRLHMLCWRHRHSAAAR
jgi:hypothetical protein